MNQNRNENHNGNNSNGIFNFILSGLIFAIVLNLIFGFFNSKRNIEINYSQFIKLVETDNISQVVIDADQISMKLKEDFNEGEVAEILNLDAITSDTRVIDRALRNTGYFYTGAIENPDLISFLNENEVNFTRPVVRSNQLFTFFVGWILPILIFTSISRFMYSRMMKNMGSSGGAGGIFNAGKSKAKMYNMEKDTHLTFDDVAGQNEAKESLQEIIDFLHNPKKYSEIGAKQPRGALLVGPPGTGKTLLAKAVAGEAKVPFFSISGSEFVEMFVGVGASRVRDLFEQANKNSPCIIFIDEIDAIGKSRDGQMGGNDEREQTLNQLLTEMDGFEANSGVVVLAATNRPESLDKALLRPGRFDRQIIVNNPDFNGRLEILKVHLKNAKTEENLYLKNIAYMTAGASGVDLANIANEAALRAVRMNRSKVSQEDLRVSVETVIAGAEMKDRILSPNEKKLVSYHEVGHALTSALQKNTTPVQKITIIPSTKGALGYTLQVPEEERFLMTKDELLEQVVVLLGGRAAEKVMMNTDSTGVANDIERATSLARSMVTQYGMSEEFGLMGLESTTNQYLDGRNVMTCSDVTGESIDKVVNNIISSCYERAKELLLENTLALEEIFKFLYEKETITGEEFMSILEKTKGQKL